MVAPPGPSLDDEEDQFTVGLGLRRTEWPEQTRSLYWSLSAGVANVPGRALVTSSAPVLPKEPSSKWGYFLQPRLGLVFEAKELPALSLDVSAGLDFISWSRATTIQHTLSFGLTYAL